MNPANSNPLKSSQQAAAQNSAQNAPLEQEDAPPIQADSNAWEMITTLSLEGKDLEHIKEKNETNVQRTKDFNASLKAVLTSGTQEEKLENLRDFCFGGEGIQRFNEMELTEIYYKFSELGGFNEMDVMMSEAPSDDFKSRYTNREMHARALMLKSPPELEIANHVITTIINDIIQGRGELHEMDRICLGEACAIRAEILSAQNASPEKIAKAYENAFAHAKNPDHGIKAAQYLKTLTTALKQLNI